MVVIDKEVDSLQVRLPDGSQVRVAIQSKATLAARTDFFGTLLSEDDATAAVEQQSDGGKLEPDAQVGMASWEEAIARVAASLAPNAAKLLPRVLEVLSSPSDLEVSQWLSAGLLFDAFAVAHFLGAASLLSTMKAWAACEPRRLVSAIEDCDDHADEVTLRIAADQGLDGCSGTKLLHAAAIADATAAAKILLAAENPHEGSLPIDGCDANGRTPLHMCAIHNSAGVAGLLIEASAALESLCDFPDDEDMEDTGQGNTIATGTDDTKSKPRLGIRTPLHLAAMHNHPEVVQLLLDAKANISACVKDMIGACTPLHEAAGADAEQALRILALAAAAEGEVRMSVQLPLLEETLMGAQTEADDAMMHDSTTTHPSEVSVPWARYLDPLNAKCGPHGSTPLHFAAENNAPGAVAALLDAKAELHAEDDNGDTALHCAVLYAAPRALQKLIDARADLMRQNAAGELALHHVAEFGPGLEEEESSTMPVHQAKRHFSKSIQAQKTLIAALRAQGTLPAALTHAAAGESGNTALHSVALPIMVLCKPQKLSSRPEQN